MQAKREKYFPRPSRLKLTGDQGDDGCESHFGTSQQHETRNKRSTSHDRPVLEQEPAYRAGQIRFRFRKRTIVGDQTGTVGHDETLCLKSRLVRHYDRMSNERLMYSVGIGPPEEKSALCSLDRIRGGNEANEVD